MSNVTMPYRKAQILRGLVAANKQLIGGKKIVAQAEADISRRLDQLAEIAAKEKSDEALQRS